MNQLFYGDNLPVLRDRANCSKARIQRGAHPDYEPDLNQKKAKAEAHGEQAGFKFSVEWGG